MNGAAQPFDWTGIRLVAFDVDGTLYRQQPVRVRIACRLLRETLRTRRLQPLRVLRSYRRIREQLGDQEVEDFVPSLLARTAAASGVHADDVTAIVTEWIEEKPLRHLLLARYEGVDRLFAGLRERGKIIGILSDYPVHAKLAALGLAADHVVSAADPAVARLKPHPAGLNALIAAAGATPAQTVLIGDRVERDGYAARRAGAHALIRSTRPLAGWRTFSRFDDPIFASFMRAD